MHRALESLAILITLTITACGVAPQMDDTRHSKASGTKAASGSVLNVYFQENGEQIFALVDAPIEATKIEYFPCEGVLYCTPESPRIEAMDFHGKSEDAARFVSNEGLVFNKDDMLKFMVYTDDDKPQYIELVNFPVNLAGDAAVVTKDAFSVEPKPVMIEREEAATGITDPMVPNPNNVPLTHTEFEVIRLTNIERDRVGKPALIVQDSIMDTARESSRLMQEQKKLQHGLTSGWNGENIAYGYIKPELVVQAWIDSPSHYSNMIADFVYIGVGDTAKVGGGKIYWTQQFNHNFSGN